MTHSRVSLLACLALSAVATPLLGQPAAPSYAKQVKPFFARYCLECHGGRDPEGGLVLETYKGLAAGGDHGAVLTPGKPDASRIVRMVEGKTGPRMPPKKAARQPGAEEVALLRAWVASGAKDDSAVVRLTLPEVAPKAPVRAPVTALAYHPGGKLLAAAGRGEVLFFNATTGDLSGQLGGQNDKVTALAFSRDGKHLAVASSTAGGAHEVRLYDFDAATAPGVRNGAVVNKHDDVIYDLAFSPDGRLLASCGYDRVIRLWDVAQKKELRILKDHSDAVYGVAFSPDGKLLASGSADRAVKVWDVAAGRRLHTLGEPTDWVYAVAWSPDGRHLAAAGVDRSIRVWEVTTEGGRIVHSVFAHEGPVTRLDYAADGKTLYSLGEDRSAKAWDAARMVERRVYAAQAETPLALSVRPDGAQLAVGRYDGVLVLLAEATGKVQAEPLPIKPKPPVLSKLSPTAGVRGREVMVKLEGKHLRGATALTSTLPGLKAALVPGGGDGEVQARFTIPATTPAGAYPLRVKTPAGESGPMSFTVDLFAPVAEAEPNDSPRTGQAVTLPATLVGSVGRAGDVDYYRFEAKAGQEVGVQALTAALGSKLEPILVLADGDGRVLAESNNGLLGFTCPRAGTYALGVRDREYRGGGPMHYRLHVGAVPVVNGVFPLGLRRGTEAEVRVDGVHLGTARTVRIKASADAAVGSRLPVPVAALGAPSVVVGEFPEAVVKDRRGTLPVPGTANGVIAEAGATDAWRFTAHKGRRLLIEVEARRIGSPLDSFIEVLDAVGRPLPRATLRCVSKTYVAFRDHDSRSPGIRLETWNDLAMNDYLLVGEELVRIWQLPKNPDDDCQFFSSGGQRLGHLGTTPTFQSMGRPMYKVAIHPPGATFPPNGLPVVTLYYRNDDGGPGFGKDSRLVFDPPADGDYQVRVGDARGLAGPRHAYRLTVRPPRPSFTVRFSPTAPAVSKGGAVPVTVTASRADEFDGPIEVRLENLPPGLHAPATTIPAGESRTSFALYAGPTTSLPAKAVPPKLVARAVIDGKELVREVAGGLPKLIEPGEIVTTTEQSEVTVRPGGEVRVTVNVERRNGFKGRIPIEVQGLPHGVHVLDVGLNGILITEAESRRTFVIRAEPWVAPTAHPFVVLAKREGKNTEHAAKSVLLKVAGK